jgi:hypothetical protein
MIIPALIALAGLGVFAVAAGLAITWCNRGRP